MNQINQKHNSMPDKEHTINSLIITLYDCSNSGMGSNVLVQFNEAVTDPFIDERPSAIGLAHELIHAYYSAKGLQPSSPDRLLDDLICIGLGPWFNEPVTDNKMRGEWNGVVYSQVPIKDVANKVKVGLRLNHDDLGVIKNNTCIMM